MSMMAAEYESDQPEEQVRQRQDARAKVIEAAQMMFDSWGEGYEGAIVTGFVLITEAVVPTGQTALTWCGGNGLPPGSEGFSGLPPHRIDGMLRGVIREVYEDGGSTE